MLGYFAAIGCQPTRIRNSAVVDCCPREELIVRQGAMGPAQPSELRDEFDQAIAGIVPVKPSGLVVLGIRIVVAVLTAAELVTSRQHGRTARDHERGEQGSYVVTAMCLDIGVGRRTFRAIVPRNFIGRAVAIVLSVRQVALRPIGHEILQREAIMRRHIVDAA